MRKHVSQGNRPSRSLGLVVAACCGWMAIATTAQAAPQESITFTNVTSDGAWATAVDTRTTTFSGAYVPRSIRLTGSLTKVNSATFRSEARVYVLPPSGAGFELQPALQTSFTGPTVLTDDLVLPIPTPLASAAGLWTFKFFESFDDGGVGSVDSTWDSIQFTLDDALPDGLTTLSGPSPYLEVEPNDNTFPNNSTNTSTTTGTGNIYGGANMVASMAVGESITGTTTGTALTTPGATSADNFLIRTAPTSIDIYKYQLALTTTGTAGHTCTLRGFSQNTDAGAAAPGVILVGSDTSFQTHVLSGTTRVNQWYGFGKGENVHYRVTGGTTTTAPYSSVLSRSTVTPIDLGTLGAGPVTIGRAAGNTNTVSAILFDSNLNAIVDGSRHGFTTTPLVRTLGPGVYYLAVSNVTTSNSLASPVDSPTRTNTVMTAPDGVINSSTTTVANLNMTVSTLSGDATSTTAAKTAAFDVVWFKFTLEFVETGACCRPDGTCFITTEGPCDTLGLGAVYHPGESCPPAGGCAAAGACCAPDGVCTQLVEVACLAPSTWSAGACPVVGYTANPDCNPNFIDISTTGTEVLGFTSLDDSAVTVALPFTFKFYGANQTGISVGTNGYLVFTPGSAASIPPDAPLSGGQQNNSIYVYGEDLHLRGVLTPPAYEGHIYTQQIGTSPDSIFIVQWTNVDLFSPTQPNGQRNTFQVKLYEASGVVEMQYLSLNLTGLSPLPADVVIGVRQTATSFTEVSQSVVGAGPKALIFAPNAPCNPTLLATGSCCVSNQPCSVVSQAACQLACGIYQGNGTNCTTNPCVTEACCLPQGGCVDVLVVACATLGGTPQGPGSDCAGANCPPAGRCCTATGACSVTTQANCQTAGSTWVQGENCTTLPCVLGACCAADGSCSQLTEAGCTDANGIRWTAATSCTPNLCQGRCCAPDGSCSVTAFNACVAPSIYGGDGTNCSTPGLCTGRCCLANGNCSVESINGCGTLGGTLQLGLDCTAVTPLIFDNIGLVIPDSPAPAVSDVQVVSGLPTQLTDVDVDVFIAHTFFADLVISVEHNGVVVALTNGAQACFGDDPNIVLDDEGTGGPIQTLACPSGIVPSSPPNYTPLSPLSAFDGMDPNGPWTISIRDDAGLDTGTLRRWSLHISTDAPVCPVVGCTCYGDMTGDSIVDGADIVGFTACVVSGGGAGCACADMDHVGGVDANDVDEFVAALLSGTCGAP